MKLSMSADNGCILHCTKRCLLKCTQSERGCNFFTHMFKNGLHRLYKELKLIHVIIILKGTSPQQLHDSFNRMISSSAIHTKSISWQKGSGRPSK